MSRQRKLAAQSRVWFSQTSIHLQKSLEKRKKNVFNTLPSSGEEVGLKVTWAFFPQFRTFYFTAPNITTCCFFFSHFIYFHTRGDEMFPVRQENRRVALQGFLSCVGPRILGWLPSRLALRGMAVLKQALLSLPRSWIQLRVQQRLEAKGPGSCHGLKGKMSQGGKKLQK